MRPCLDPKARRAFTQTRRAFTLLEMIIALMVTAMIVFTIYRFVSAHLMAINATMDIGNDRDVLNRVVKLLQTQLDTLPVPQTNIQQIAPGPGGVATSAPNVTSQAASVLDGSLTGKAYKFRGLSNDEITWICPAGSGLLTTAAPGEFEVTLTVQPVTESSSETELGLRRRPAAGNKVNVELNRGGDAGRYDWLPLIRPMAALEISYFDAAVHSWTDKWADPTRRPALVRLRLQKYPEDAPVEAVIGIPSAQVVR